jgi:RNA polymerase sigma-70 factor (ECF subfamily)
MADDSAPPTGVPLVQGASSASDAELATQLRAGDFAAFTRVYDLLAGPAYSLVYRLLGETGDAEDVVQEVLLSLWERPERYDATRGTLRTWVLSAVHHRAVDRIRRRASHPQMSLDATAGSASQGNGTGADARTTVGDLLGGSSGDDPAECAESAERATAVRRALGDLPDHQRDAIVLAYFGGLTQQQIAIQLHEPLGTVKTRLRLALARLRRLLSSFDERAASPATDLFTPPQAVEREGGYPHGDG